MTGYVGGPLLATVVRSGFAESFHHGSVAIVDASGRLTRFAGDPYGPIFPRSSNKPMQAVAMLRSGLRPADLPDPLDLAVVAASHSGEPIHVNRIAAMLAAGGLTESDLLCPPALPLSEPAHAAVLRDGGDKRRLYMNCSGKHAGMLLTCRAAGWPIKQYLAVDHPLQVACRTALADLAGEPVAAVGVDGCGAPVMAISLAGLARAFAGLVAAPVGTPERTVSDAMRARPDLVSGTDREDLALMGGVPGLLSKVGAEGVMAVAVPGIGAVALKIDDGAPRARMPVLVAALRELGVDAPVLDELLQNPKYGSAVSGGGEIVGSVNVHDPLPTTAP